MKWTKNEIQQLYQGYGKSKKRDLDRQIKD